MTFRLVNIYRLFEAHYSFQFKDCFILKMKALQPSETPVIIYPLTRRNLLEDLLVNVRLHRCESLKSRKYNTHCTSFLNLT